MDYSTKVTTVTPAASAGAAAGTTQSSTRLSENRSNNRRSSDTQADAAASLTTDQQEAGYPCPACSIVLTTSRDLTNHLRGHNSPRSTDYSGEEDYSCGVCHKVLSSASSLDRHVLVHSGERPFKCKYCDMAFTTNGNMNRHLRTAHGGLSPRENSYTDSEASSDSDKPAKRRRVDEYNNNEIAKRESPDFMDQTESPSFVAKRGCPDFTDDNDNQRRHRILLNNSRTELRTGTVETQKTPVYNCPVCGRLDFATSALLESHLERNHPEFPAKCEPCNLSFKNHRVLNLHKYMKHIAENSFANNARNLRNSVVGFHDLTFVDFSSDKFPAIARAVCEQSLHRPASGEIAKFQCGKCLRAFPCRSALDAHELDCGTSQSQTRVYIDDQSRRDDFFAGLDLQNKAALNEAKEGKDLADIQSIISVTSGPILQNFPRSDASTPEHQIKMNPNVASSGSSGTHSSEYHQEEEAQDAFAAEFRKMKLKGEFPCRLCTAVFPNLRALKGHNRAHMGVGPGMPYPCNMCPYTSTDKATLVRHLRSHNGDRPFECSLCNYAFTTKANCERHVRNRHGKLTREDIKSVLIYHPSEDYTNDGSLDRASPRGIREDARKTLVFPHERDDYGQNVYSGLSLETKQELGNVSDDGQIRPMSLQALRAMQLGRYDKPDIFSRIPSHVGIHPLELSHRMTEEEQEREEEEEEEQRRRQDKSRIENVAKSDYSGKHEEDGEEEDGEYREEEEDEANSRSSEDDESVSLVSDTKSDVIHQRVQASPIDLKKSTTASATTTTTTTTTVRPVGLEPGEASASTETEDAPLDLSMDVLDLSKKSKGTTIPASSPAATTTPDPELGRNQKEFYDATNQFLLTQALLKAGQTGNPATSLEALYANAHMIYRNFGGFSAAGVGAGILPPYLFNPHMFGQDFTMKDRLQKELFRGLQLTSGGNLVEPPISNTAFAGAYPSSRDIPVPSTAEQSDYAKLVSSKLPTKTVSPRDKMDNSQSSSSVKMVIKNGVLMPKQKQRRYRTERPFTCEHCSAKFTLRSNMERHIKQQHPQHWSQRPRGGHSTRGRPPANPPTLLHSANHHTSQQLSQSYPNILPKIGQPTTSLNYEKHSISDQVKYAILAQQLKGNKIEENDTEEELVIDEAAQERESHENEHDDTQRPTSLLRGKLEGNDLYKDLAARQLKASSETIKKNSAKMDEDSGERAEMENTTEKNCRDTIEVKVEPEEQREEDIKDCVPSELCVAEITKIEQSSRDGMSEKNEDGTADLASVSELLDNASQQYQQFQPQYMSDEEGLVASTSDCNNSGSDEKSDSVHSANSTNSTSSKKKKKKTKKMKKKKSAYSMAPNRVICPYCQRAFPWTSSLRRHILTHTGQKPYQCMHCSLLFTTKSNCDRHLLRKHKNNANKIRRLRNSSSPDTREQLSNNNINNGSNNNSNNNNSNNTNTNSSSSTFAMRNVPERPYKCNLCPSSTFSTLGNLKKHKSSKHSRGTKSRPESPATSEPQNSPMACNKQNDQSDYESQSSNISENMDRHGDKMETLDNSEVICANTTTETRVKVEPTENIESTESCEVTGDKENSAPTEQQDRENVDNAETPDNPMSLENPPTKNNEVGLATTNETSKSRRPSPRSSPSPTDAPFKCHLCDSGFAERQDCLEHIRINHTRSYEILVAKGALDMDIETPDEQQQQQPRPPSSLQQHLSDGEEKRGRFPDYSNRKVVCAFCMRRFWSAEDLRRHMRTHTGERPFSCDICCRRFTLKHSMLRHRKKHESVDSMMYVGTSGDEESAPSQPPTITPRSQQQQQASMLTSSSCDSRIQERVSPPTAATLPTGDATPSPLVRFNPYEKLTTLTGKLSNAQHNFHASESPDTENDLISNLLGIRDKSIIDKVLQASADDAAKLLGVNRNHD